MDSLPGVAETVYGRDELIEQLARSEAPLTLLTGDSGIGGKVTEAELPLLKSRSDGGGAAEEAVRK